MFTSDNVRYLLTIGNRYIDDAKAAIERDNIMDANDKKDMIEVVESNDFKAFCELDTIVRDHLIDALATEFNFLEYKDYIELSDIVLDYMKLLSTMQSIMPKAATKALQADIDKACKWNNKLCDMMERVDPEHLNEVQEASYEILRYC